MLCECELYAPANYDNDLEMKSVMENFSKQTEQRFHEYDDRMKEKRKQCKDKCDKEIQKIILKDKLEKQIAQQLTTLDTNITTEDIPTCICEKSVADKVEKGCLRCGGVLGGGIAPTVGLIGSVAVHMWKPKALAAAIKAALELNADNIATAAKAAAIAKAVVQGAIEGNSVGMNFVNSYLEHMVLKFLTPDLSKKMSSADLMEFEDGVSIYIMENDVRTFFQSAEEAVPKFIDSVVRMGKGHAETKAAQVIAAKTPEFTTENITAVNTAYGGLQTAIIASIVAIVVIILVMVIIYKILRYRRKKKMKKKLQYIKLLEE
ncbi:rifin PIR protein, putative [Plasmodium reichenowi]|uniref:Rifin PIR protein, putative n=1 Tax=Plasmodium reichenowi TaxID=5854 RepID=A0A2P9D4T2_PLARE|nr:rifin PIR protein, putative [Plasmodium reichenowi]